MDNKLEANTAAKVEESHFEDSRHAQSVIVTEADNVRIRRKTDLVMLSALCVAYFLQISDKTIIGLSAIYGLRQDANLVGNQYSTIGAIGYYAQLGAQPLAAYLLVKLKIRMFAPLIVFCWGVSLLGLAFSRNFASLAACRFLLGFFEAACLPLFSLITVAFYRRSEQPLRIAAWYSTNGLATLVCSFLVWALAKAESPHLYTYQIIYLFFALLTILFGISLWFWISESPAEARFLKEQDRPKAVERLRANQQGARDTHFKWRHIFEMVTEVKFWLFMFCTFVTNAGAAVSNVFGPLILQGLGKLSNDRTVILNMGFGAMQFVTILLASWLAVRLKNKGFILMGFMLVTLLAVGLLFGYPHTEANQTPLLAGYYLFSFLFAANPLLVSWIGSNVAGQTKKSAYFTAYNAFSSVGNIAAPYMLKSTDAPDYTPGLEAVTIMFAILVGLIAAQMFNLAILNKRKEKQRVKNGKPAKLTDYSMTRHVHEEASKEEGSVFTDLTDKENDLFIYVL